MAEKNQNEPRGKEERDPYWRYERDLPKFKWISISMLIVGVILLIGIAVVVVVRYG